MKYAWMLGVGLYLLSRTASADPLEGGAGAGAFVSSDSEGFTTNRYQMYILPAYRNGDHLTGAKLSYYQFSQDEKREHGEQISLVHRNGHPGDALNLQLDVGLSRQGEHQLVSFDGNYSQKIANGTRVEVFGTRDWVETIQSLQRGTYFSFVGAALEQELGQHLTLIGLGGGQFFSDGNRRDHVRLRAIYQPVLDSGIALHLRYNYFHSSDHLTDPGYFNPEQYQRLLLGIGYRKRMQGWVGALNIATGPQRINSDALQRSDLAEIYVESPRNAGHSLKVRSGYSRSAGLSGPDYIYRYLQVEWLLAF